jgi:CRISPR system Cascade subunit CasB
VAALFAWHQRPWEGDEEPWRRNLGASFERLAPADSDERVSVERRFTALLACHAEELPNHLRHAIGLLRASEIPVDWTLLLRDLQYWEDERRTVQRAWARAFWRPVDEPTTSSSTSDSGEPELTDDAP